MAKEWVQRFDSWIGDTIPIALSPEGNKGKVWEVWMGEHGDYPGFDDQEGASSGSHALTGLSAMGNMIPTVSRRWPRS